MIGWQGLGSSAQANDYWSTDASAVPKLDDVQNLDSTHKISDSGERVKFVTKRKLDTGDPTEDYVIPLKEEIDMVYSIRYSSGNWEPYELTGHWSINFDFGPTIVDLEDPVVEVLLQPSTVITPDISADESKSKEEDDDFMTTVYIAIGLLAAAFIAFGLMFVLKKYCGKREPEHQEETK